MSTPGVRKSRRSTFDPPPTDLWERYARHRTRSARAIAFIEGECKVPTGRGTNRPYKLLPFQKRLLRATLDDGDLVVIWSMPRGAGKTGLAAPLLVWGLFDVEGAQVIGFGTGMRTARLAYDRAVHIIETNPRLKEQTLVFTNATEPYVEIPHRAAKLFPLPAEERHIVGMSPTLAIVDEVGYVSRNTYEAAQTSMGKSVGSLLLGIGTPGLGTMDGTEANLMWRLRELALGPEPPPGLRYLEHAARPTDDPGDPRTWKRANPGLGTLVEQRQVALDYATMPASRFGQMRLGLWTQHEAAWMQQAIWDDLEVVQGKPPTGCSITIGFDGSTSGDATALMGYELATGRLFVLGVWARPEGAPKDWKVPRSEVMAVIDQAFTDYTVVGMLADPWGWRSELQELGRRFTVVQEFNTAHRGRMGPATDAFLSAAMKGELRWDGTPALRAHVLSAVAVKTQAGDVLAKDARRPQLIDLAVASILAHEAGRIIEAPVPVGIW